MGFRFRKSFNLGGGFRINLSKSGIGYSWGVPGYRITRTAKGRTRKSYSIPGTGIGFVEESSSKKQRLDSSNNGNPNLKQTKTGDVYNPNDYYDMENIETASIKNFQPGEYKQLLTKINLRKAINIVFNIMCFALIPYFLWAPKLWLILTAIIGFFSKIFLMLFCKIKIKYEFEEEFETCYKKYVLGWKELIKSKKIWQILQQGKVRNTKNMAGADTAVARKDMSISFRLPWYLKCDIKVPVLRFKKITLILFPDKILVINKLGAGAVTQKNVNFEFVTIGFLETDFKPKDSEILQYQWLHPNKDGGPDKRFENNKKLPVYKYGKILITSPDGINEIIMVTNETALNNLSNLHNEYKKVFDNLE